VSIKFYKISIGFLILFSLVCLALLADSLRRYSELESDVRYANDIVWSFDENRDDAFKSDVTNAADILWRLHYPGMPWRGKPEPFHGSLANLVEHCRLRCERDIINYLRAKTGENLGNDPEAWIFKYAGDQSKAGLKAMKEPDASPGQSTN